MNPVVYVHSIAALLAIVLAVPLMRRKVGMNMWYGVRIPASFASEKEWLRINEYGGRQLLLWGLVLAGTATVGMFVGREHWVTYNWVSLAVALGGLALAATRVLRFARATREADPDRRGTTRGM